MTDIIASIDAQRKQRGFLGVAYLLERYSKNVILDPFSTLISENIEMGQGNLMYPNVIIEAKNGGSIWMGNNNILFPGTLFLADQGEIRIGNNNEFGDGGLRLKANMHGASITIGDFGRYTMALRSWANACWVQAPRSWDKSPCRIVIWVQGRVTRRVIPTYEEDC